MKALRIGLISDTHGFIDPRVFYHFKEVDEIWHAGDIGDTETLNKLQQFKPVKAVFGNIDPPDLRRNLSEDLRFTAGGMEILITHIGGYPPKYNKRTLGLLDVKNPDLFITGHSHILKVMTDPQHGNMLFINPGAAGKQGFHRLKTLVRFSILNKKVNDLQVIELGKKG